jgi:hypothetical protein
VGIEGVGVPPKEPCALCDDWMQRAALVQSYRKLAGITDPVQPIGPARTLRAGTYAELLSRLRYAEAQEAFAVLA